MALSQSSQMQPLQLECCHHLHKEPLPLCGSSDQTSFFQSGQSVDLNDDTGVRLANIAFGQRQLAFLHHSRVIGRDGVTGRVIEIGAAPSVPSRSWSFAFYPSVEDLTVMSAAIGRKPAPMF
jgi:hypothetical protein